MALIGRIPSGNVAATFYPLLWASFAIKAYDYGQVFHFYHKIKRKTVDKTFWVHAAPSYMTS